MINIKIDKWQHNDADLQLFYDVASISINEKEVNRDKMFSFLSLSKIPAYYNITPKDVRKPQAKFFPSW